MKILGRHIYFHSWIFMIHLNPLTCQYSICPKIKIINRLFKMDTSRLTYHSLQKVIKCCFLPLPSSVQKMNSQIFFSLLHHCNLNFANLLNVKGLNRVCLKVSTRSQSSFHFLKNIHQSNICQTWFHWYYITRGTKSTLMETELYPFNSLQSNPPDKREISTSRLDSALHFPIQIWTASLCLLVLINIIFWRLSSRESFWPSIRNWPC